MRSATSTAQNSSANNMPKRPPPIMEPLIIEPMLPIMPPPPSVETNSRTTITPAKEPTAAPVSIDPCVVASWHETVFEGSQIEGVSRGRLGRTQAGCREDLLGVDANHKALAQEEEGDRVRRARADPRQARKERGDAQGVAARAPAGQRRPYLGRAPRGFRGALRGGGLHLHHREGHLWPARWRLAAQKKSPVASERDEQARGLWRWLASRFDARRLVFVDESGFNTSMTRLRARAPKGKRAYGKVPKNRGKNTTLIAAITLEGAMGTSMTVEGATDSEAFEAYVEHFLAPSLREGQVVVLDGLGAHRPKRIRDLIEERGADLVFLPSYSPDMNPIEEAFSKIKHLVRKAGARVREALVEVIGRALTAVTIEDAAGWFAHAGYWPQDQSL